MELFCPPTNINPTVIDSLGIHICKSKAYSGEKYLMPRIGAAKVKKILQQEYELTSALFDADYKGKGVCLRYYPIRESFTIRIQTGTVFRTDEATSTPIADDELLSKICKFHGVKSSRDLADVAQMRLFLLEETKKFGTPKRTKNKNNSYSTEFYFSELETDILPTGDEKRR